MERPTQYATTSDGVQIAFTTKGEGIPYVEMSPIPFCHGAGPAEVPDWQVWDEEISRRGMLVMYDPRGTGMSDRDVTDYSLEGWASDIDAVVDALELETFVLFAPDSVAVPVAITYSAANPARVSHLILWQAHAHLRHLVGDPGFATVLELIDRDWELFSQVLVQVMEGYVEAETAQREAAMLRELHSPDGLKAAFAAAATVDVSGILPQVKAPTLVLHRRGGRQQLDDALEVTSGIPNAGLTMIDGSAFGWALQHPKAVLEAIDGFLGWTTETQLPRDTAGLSPRELEVLALLAIGRSAREMGEELVLTVRTVERHISNIYRKIGARNRAQATAFALDHGLARRQ